MTEYRILSATETPRNGDQSKHREHLGAEWRTLTPRNEHFRNSAFEYRRPLQERPQPGVVITGTVHRVIDGDTVEVEVTRRVVVRLLDCWSPESRKTKHPTEKPFGLKAKAAMQGLAAVGSECTVQIPTDGDLDAFDGFSFGRAVGDMWLCDKMTLTEQMRVSGHTYSTKAELEAFLTAEDNRQAKENYDKI